jgi:hypothetical protein
MIMEEITLRASVRFRKMPNVKSLSDTRVPKQTANNLYLSAFCP